MMTNNNNKIDVFTPLEHIKPRWRNWKEYLDDALSLRTPELKQAEPDVTYAVEEEILTDDGKEIKILVPMWNILNPFFSYRLAVKDEYEFLQLAEKIRNLDWLECEYRPDYDGSYYAVITIPCVVCCKIFDVNYGITLADIEEGHHSWLIHDECKYGRETHDIPIIFKKTSEGKCKVKYLEWSIKYEHKDLYLPARD
jgi:hypothetical protein